MIPTPTPKATLRLDASGKRAVKLRVTCPARCTLDAKLTVDSATAKKLGLRGSRTVGTVRRTLAAGSSTTITVSLTSKAKRGPHEVEAEVVQGDAHRQSRRCGSASPGNRQEVRPLIGIVLAALLLPASAHAAQPNAAQRALERRLGPQAVVDIDAETGTPRVLARLDGTLSAPASGAPADVALRYVRANLPALGLTEADLDTLQAPETTSAGGVTEVRWSQAVDGIRPRRIASCA